MFSSTIIGAWIAAFLTLGIFSYLYRDNPFYKIAEHVFVGVSAAYWAATFYWTQIYPNLFGRLFAVGGPFESMYVIDKGHEFSALYFFPLLLGIMMLLSVFRQFNWMARWGIAYTVGIAAGLKAFGYLKSNVVEQVKSTAVDLFSGDLPIFAMSGDSIFNNIVIFIGTISALMYFYFSREQSGTYGRFTRLGVYFLMISFGASFGFAVMGRISLLIGRFNDLILFSGPSYNHGTFWMLGLIVAVLAYWSFKNPEKQEV
ncbi:MAG: hypothetical protein VYA20_03665 [Candidatus Neomarinimicrobiota bacterium]|nr:hypothetical protein [Candidatus Neomarinimicrobiota bacterium]